MAEYIEKQKAKDELLAWAVCIQRPQYLRSEDAMCVLDCIPTADVEQVTRCKDCKHYDRDQCYHPRHERHQQAIPQFPDDYCSYGEKRA